MGNSKIPHPQIASISRSIALTTLAVVVWGCGNQGGSESAEKPNEAPQSADKNPGVQPAGTPPQGSSGADPEITGKALPANAHRVLLEILHDAEIESVRVTSISRTAADQARVMYNFIGRNGVQAALRLYGPEGDAIIRIYEQNQGGDRQAVIEKMHQETLEQLPIAHANNRLMHTNSTHDVFDIAFSSVPVNKREAFLLAARNHADISRVLGPDEGEQDAFHLEIVKVGR